MREINWDLICDFGKDKIKERCDEINLATMIEEADDRFSEFINEIPQYKYVRGFMDILSTTISNYISLPMWSSYHTDLTFDSSYSVNEYNKLISSLTNASNICLSNLGKDLKDDCKRCTGFLRFISRCYRRSDYKIINRIKTIIESWVSYLEENDIIDKDNVYRRELERDFIFNINDACWK